MTNYLIASEIKESEFKSLTKSDLDRIEKGMIEHERIMNCFGRNNSQTTGKLMSLTMLSEGPYRRLRQCAAEIEKRKNALMESSFELRSKKRKVEHYNEMIRKNQSDLGFDVYQADMRRIKRDKLEWEIQATKSSIEGALKDIASMQDAYNQIRESFNIPENWDEADFENAEIKAHLMSAFRLAFFDFIERGHIGRAANEYLSQFGIHPYTAKCLLKDYSVQLDQLAKQNQMPSITHFYNWLDSVSSQMENAHKETLAHIGLKDLISEWCQFREVLNR